MRKMFGQKYKKSKDDIPWLNVPCHARKIGIWPKQVVISNNYTINFFTTGTKTV